MYIYIVRVTTERLNGDMITAFSSETKAKAYTEHLKEWFKDNPNVSVSYTKELVFTTCFWKKKEGE